MTNSEAQLKGNLEASEVTIGNCFREGWDILWGNFPRLALLWLITSAISLGISLITGYFGEDSGIINRMYLMLVSFLASVLISIPIGFGLRNIYLKTIQGKSSEISNLFDGFNNYFNLVVGVFLGGILSIIGLIFFVIPGLIVMCKLSFLPYLLIDRKMQAIEAIKESWFMTNGHTGQLFLMLILGVLISILGLLLLIVGIIPAIMWVDLAFAAFYNKVSQTQATELEEFAPIN